MKSINKFLILAGLILSYGISAQTNQPSNQLRIFHISVDSINSLPYDEKLTPLHIVAREIYGNKTHNSRFAEEHILFEEYVANIGGITVEEAQAFSPRDSLKNWVLSLYQPLFIVKNGIKLAPWNENHISFNYRLDLFREGTGAIVLVDGHELYFLRKLNNLWKLNNYAPIDFERD